MRDISRFEYWEECTAKKIQKQHLNVIGLQYPSDKAHLGPIIQFYKFTQKEKVNLKVFFFPQAYQFLYIFLKILFFTYG